MLNSMLPALTAPRLGSLLNSEMNHLFDGFFDGARKVAATLLPLSVWEDNDRVYIQAETPGAKIDDIELVFHDGALRIAYARPAPENERKYWLNERGYGRFERLVRLPDTVDENSIQAELNSGLLQVTLGKKPELQPRKIIVQAGDAKPALAENGHTAN
jgi:HSP20 family protein